MGFRRGYCHLQGPAIHNAKEELNGRDDDGNGYIDDVHGIAYDLESNRNSSPLYPLKDAQSRLPAMKNNIKGMLDLQAAIDSPEAGELKKTMSAIKPDEVQPFMEDLSLFSNYSHGTHVAGIAAAGQSLHRGMLSARMTYDHRVPSRWRPTEGARRRRRLSCIGETLLAYFKANGVRVVNMSWGGSQKGVEAALEANGIEKDAAKRAELARGIFKISRDGLYEALRSAPEFCSSARPATVTTTASSRN